MDQEEFDDGDNHEEGIATEEKEKIKVPRRYKIILLNDDYTTMEFVIEVLMKFFNKTESEAMHIMMTVHKKGAGVAGIYTCGIAETKLNQVNTYAKHNNHPLKCTMEPE